MTIVKRTKGCPAWMWLLDGARNKLGFDTGRYGLFRYGAYEFGAENEIGLDHTGVYQRRMTKHGYRTVKMRFQITREETVTDKRTAAWNNYRDAQYAWHALTDEQKNVYNELVKGKPLNGNNLFVKEYMLSH